MKEQLHERSKPLTSIIMPVYNVEAFIESALLSIKNQTYPHIELIAINDGSTDKSLEILELYKKNNLMNHEMIIFSQENKGLSEARNAGLPFVKGKYLYFFDSDDLLDKHCIEKCVAFAEEENLDLVHFGAEIIERSKEHDEEKYLESDLIHQKVYSQAAFYRQSAQKIRIPVWLYFYKSELILDQLYFYPDLIHEDELFTPQVLASAHRIGVLNENFFKRRIRTHSIMTTQNLQMIEKKINSITIILDKLNQMRQNCSPEQKFFIESRLISLSKRKKALESETATNRKILPLPIVLLMIKRQFKKFLLRIMH